MNEKLPSVWAVLVTALSIIGALVGVIWLSLRTKVERTEMRLDDHIRDDTSAHERLKAVETKVDALEREVHGIRERWHDMRTEISQTLSSWYLSIVKMIGKDDR